MWVKIDCEDDLPPPYVDVLVTMSCGVRKTIEVLRHENGWWYGLSTHEQPSHWFDCPKLCKALKIAKQEELMS